MATIDIVSPFEAGEYLQFPGAVASLQSLVTAVSARIDEICGPVVVRATVEIFDGNVPDVFLAHAPVSTITSVVEHSSGVPLTLIAETSTSLPADGYRVRYEAYIERRNNGYTSMFAPGDVVVTYSAGRASTTATVSPQFKEAALITISHLWQTERGTGNAFGVTDTGVSFGPTFSVPRRALDILGHQIKAPALR